MYICDALIIILLIFDHMGKKRIEESLQVKTTEKHKMTDQ